MKRDDGWVALTLMNKVKPWFFEIVDYRLMLLYLEVLIVLFPTPLIKQVSVLEHLMPNHVPTWACQTMDNPQYVIEDWLSNSSKHPISCFVLSIGIAFSHRLSIPRCYLRVLTVSNNNWQLIGLEDTRVGSVEILSDRN